MSVKDIESRLKSLMRFLEAQALVRTIEGFLDPVEGFALMELAASGEGTGSIVEIGSFKGLSTCWLALGAKATRNTKVYAVDHFKGSPEHQPGETFAVPEIASVGSTLPTFRANIERAGVAEIVVPIVASSAEAAPKWNSGAIRLLFIDGDHSYEASKQDFELWRRHVSPRGCIAFHDVGPWEGVTRFYAELLSAKNEYREVLSAGTLRAVQRTK